MTNIHFKQMSSKQDRENVAETIHQLYEIGANKQFEEFSNLCAQDGSYSRFDDAPPYARQNFKDAQTLIELKYAALSDYRYEIQDMRIDLYGDIALSTFHLVYSGIVVDSYSFRGQTLRGRLRVTLVLQKIQGRWRVKHEHQSRFPEEYRET